MIGMGQMNEIQAWCEFSNRDIKRERSAGGLINFADDASAPEVENAELPGA